MAYLGVPHFCLASYLLLRFSLFLQVHLSPQQSLQPLPVSTHLKEIIHQCPSQHHLLVSFFLVLISALPSCTGGILVSSDYRTVPPDAEPISWPHTDALSGMCQAEEALWWSSFEEDDWVSGALGCRDCTGYPQ